MSRKLHSWLRIVSSRHSAILLFALLLMTTGAKAQVSCSSTTPTYTVDLSKNADTSWTSASVSRAGQCCSVAAPNVCILFKVYLNSNAAGVEIDVTGGTGTTYYQNSCGTSVAVGSQMCLTGTGPFYLTICKPGGNPQTYTVKSIPAPRFVSTPTYATDNCSIGLQMVGLDASTITWTSISGSRYDSCLSCKSGCDSVAFKTISNMPAYVDYKVCGTPVSSCLAGPWCDTVRVYYVKPVSVNIDSDTVYLCNTYRTTLTAHVSGGKGPFTYLWSNGNGSSSVTADLAKSSTYWVKVTDSLNCTPVYDTVHLVSQGSISVYAGSDTTICASNNYVSLHARQYNGSSYSWSGGTGTYLSGSNSLNGTYIPSQSEINAGKAILYLTSQNHCYTVQDSIIVTIKPAPKPVINGSSQGCVGSLATYSVSNNTGSNYTWTALGGTITSGQGTSAISVKWDTSGPGYIYVKEVNSSGCEGVAGFNTISQFDFNTNPLTSATYGPNAVSKDADAYSIGKGFTILNNSSSTKGADISVPGATFNRGQLVITANYQRDEPDAIFYYRGRLKFYVSSGNLYITYRTKNSAGTIRIVGPIKVYTIPDDDVFRNYTFLFDSVTSVAKVYVDGVKVWTISQSSSSNLDWTGSGNMNLGQTMDGNLSKNVLVDYMITGIPINVFPLPDPSLSGNTPVCAGSQELYKATDTSDNNFSWAVTNGTIITGQNSWETLVYWDENASTATITLTVTNKISGCSDKKTMAITIKPRPGTSGIYH